MKKNHPSWTNSHPVYLFLSYSCHAASEEDVENAITGAHNAYKSGIWSRVSRHHRADILEKCGTLLAESLPELIQLEVQQTGRAIKEMQAQVPSLVR